MIYSPATGLRQSWAQKKIIYAKYSAVVVIALLLLIWIELIFYVVTSHYVQFPAVNFTHPGSSNGQTTAVRSGSKNWTTTSSPTTWSINGNTTAPIVTPVGGRGGGTAISPGSVVPDSNSGLPVPLPYTVIAPNQSLQLDGKQVIGTSPVGVTLN